MADTRGGAATAGSTNQAAAQPPAALPNGADESGIRAYYDLGVPIPRPGGIAGGIANGEIGSIGGDIARPDGLDFSVEFPPDESGINDPTVASGGVPAADAAGIGGDVANSGATAASNEFFPPDLSADSEQSTANGAGMFNGRTSAGSRGLDANSSGSAQFDSGGARSGSRFQSRSSAGGTIPSSRPNGTNQRGIDRLNQRFGDDF